MAHSTLKNFLATAAIMLAGSAFAQGTQPNANVANPATGAGQQSQQGTPMGTTGVLPSNNGGATMPNNTMNSAPASNMSNDTERMAPQRRMRAARADRN